MLSTVPPISFQLPDRRSIDVYVIKTKDGRTLVRTADELARKPGAAPVSK